MIKKKLPWLSYGFSYGFTLLVFSWIFIQAKTRVVELSGMKDFKTGKYENTFFNQQNQLTLNYEIKKILDVKKETIWALDFSDDKLLISHSPAGSLSLYDESFELITTKNFGENEITSIVFHENNYYFGTLESGIIYRSDSELNDFTEWAKVESEFIWDLKVDEKQLYVSGGGEAGRISVIDLANKETKNLVKVEASNILKTDLRKNKLYFSTSNPGRFYEYDLKEENLKVIYENSKNEISDFIFVGDKTYVITAGTEDKKLVDTFSNQELPTAKIDNNLSRAKKDPLKPNPINELLPESEKENLFGFINRLIEINENGDIKTLFRFNALNLTSLMHNSLENKLFVASFEKGNIWSYNLSDRTLEKIFKAEELDIAHLISAPSKAFFATANTSVIYQIDFKLPPKGYYESKVFDFKNTVNWGKFYINAKDEETGNIFLEARVGNNETPDELWNDWQSLIANPILPSSRFMQFRVNFLNQAGKTAKMDGLKFYYSSLNNRVQVKNLRVLPTYQPNKKLSAKDKAKVENATGIGSSDLGERFVNAFKVKSKKIVLAWDVQNRDRDLIRYQMHYKHLNNITGEKWFLLKKDFFKSSLVIDGNKFFDGEYVFKLAYDTYLSKGELGVAREITSPAFTIDNKEPEIVSVEEGREGIEIIVADKHSIITGGKYSYDRINFFDLTPIDNVFDEKRESFTITKQKKSLYLMFMDESGNIKYDIIPRS